jgi:hypothetical protein
MQKISFLMLLLIVMGTAGASAQVTIGSLDAPSATLDLKSQSATDAADGLLVPRISRSALAAKSATAYGADQKSALIFVNQLDGSATGTVIHVTKIGFYWFDGSVWQSLDTDTDTNTTDPGWFYLPSIWLPTSTGVTTAGYGWNATNSRFEINLYARYTEQFTATVKSGGSLPVESAADKFDYFVTYYDSSVFATIGVTTAGLLHYTLVASPVITEKTYVNIILKKK